MKAVINVTREGARLRIAVTNEGDTTLLLKNPANDLVVSANLTRLLRIDEDEREVQFEMVECSS